METKDIIFSLKMCGSVFGCSSDCKYKRYSSSYCRSSLLKDAADRLDETYKENELLKEKLTEMEQNQNESNISAPESESRSAWNSFEYETEVESNMEIIYLTQDQFPRLVVVTNENGKATHWMQLNAPKPKAPTFKDVFLKACPHAAIDEDGIPVAILCDIYPHAETNTCQGENGEGCWTCWNQPYFEPEEEGETE